MARGFKVVFTGQLAEGYEQDVIRERLAGQFKVPENKIGHFFSGQPFVVAIHPEEDEANRYQIALKQAGLQCRVIPMGDKPTRKKTYEKVPPPSRILRLPSEPAPTESRQELILAREVPQQSQAPDHQDPTPVQPVVRERRVVEIREPASNGLSTRQWLGLVGAVLMMMGAFSPVVSVPIMGTISYVNNGQGDGVLVLVMAAISLIAVFTHSYRLLGWTSTISLGVMVFTIVRFTSKMSEAKADMARDLAGNPFRGLAEAAVGAVQLQWGWGLLITGATLALAAAMIKGK